VIHYPGVTSLAPARKKYCLNKQETTRNNQLHLLLWTQANKPKRNSIIARRLRGITSDITVSISAYLESLKAVMRHREMDKLYAAIELCIAKESGGRFIC